MSAVGEAGGMKLGVEGKALVFCEPSCLRRG